MSKWRRVALEKIPSCKRLIEKADSPEEMGIRLFEELETAYEQAPPDKELIQQIYGYFFPKPRERVGDGWWNFVIRFPDSEAMQDDLHNYVSMEQLAAIEANLRGDETSEEEIAAFHRKVLAARYKRK